MKPREREVESNGWRRRITESAARGYLGDVLTLAEEAPTGSLQTGPTFRQVAVLSGHMIDAPGRPVPRFPASRESPVRSALSGILDGWNLGVTDLVMCGGAKGADILFAELCHARGAHVRLLIALEEPEFIERSVRHPGTSDWEIRYATLSRVCEVWSQPERLGPLPTNANAFERNNRWLLNTARIEQARAAGSSPLLAALVWDGNSTGDGPGGTSHFVREVKHLGGRLSIIDPKNC